MHPGLIGGLLGTLVGLAGGLVGTYFSIKNTNGPRERAFMIRSALAMWGFFLLLFGSMFLLPNPYRWFMWLPFTILLPLCILYGNKRQQEIRREETAARGVSESGSPT
jgi:hypothetical protein